jgi:hypothetical protein
MEASGNGSTSVLAPADIVCHRDGRQSVHQSVGRLLRAASMHLVEPAQALLEERLHRARHLHAMKRKGSRFIDGPVAQFVSR